MEIERKFLSKLPLPIDLAAYPSKAIRQAYLSLSPTIRIRQSAEDLILTVKGHGHLAREEFELPLSQAEFDRLATKLETPFLSKERYFVPVEGGYTAEIDVYHGALSPLVTIEVEFGSMEEAEAFQPPTWFGKDVSEDKRYKNTALSLYGIPKED